MSALKPSLAAICGKGRIATSALSYTLQALRAWGLDIPVIACPNADDRGYDTWQPSLIRRAHLLTVAIQPIEALEREPGLLLISLECDRIIKTRRFVSRRLYNIHFSKLPAYRGVYTSIWPILNGEHEVGVTLHEIDEGIDTGPAIDQRTFLLPPYATARQLYDLYTDEAFEVFKENLLRLIQGRYELTPQDDSKASYYSRKSLDFQTMEIDLQRDAEYICRFVCAFHFPEYQLPKLNGRAVSSCNVIQGASRMPVGTKIYETSYSGAFVAGCGRVVELIWG